MNKLIILSGVPGSGKSYFSKTIKKIKDNHVYVVSSDDLRALITGKQSNLTEEELMNRAQVVNELKKELLA